MQVIDQLIHRINEKQSPIVLGLDPTIQFIPDHIKSKALAEFGNTKKAVASAFLSFNREILSCIHPYVPAVKFQMACYEIYGADGIEVFHQSVELAKQFNLIVIDDAKRNDIGSTASLYAAGHIGQVPLIEGKTEPSIIDFVTINPYLGSDSIKPFTDVCDELKKGVFILVRTSNTSAADYQGARLSEGFLFEKVAVDVQELSASRIGEFGFSSIGAVIGATWPEEANKLRKLMPSVFFLVPGYGAQGGTAEQVCHCFNDKGYGALVNSSRGIIFANQLSQYRQNFPQPEQFKDAALAAVQEMKKDILTALSKAGKLPQKW